MDALSLQSAAPAATTAVNAAPAASNSAPANKPASGVAAATPLHFGKLLALHLGSSSAEAPIDTAGASLNAGANRQLQGVLRGCLYGESKVSRRILHSFTGTTRQEHHGGHCGIQSKRRRR